MEEMDIKELFTYVKGKTGYIILGTCIVCLLGALYALFIQKPVYRSSTTLVLASAGTTDSKDSGITQNDVLLNQKLVLTYREIVKSRKVLTQVIHNLQLDDSLESLSSNISVSSITDTEIIKISVENRDAETAKKIANDLAKVFSNEVIDIYNVRNVSILDVANMPTRPSNINIPKQLFLYFAFGFILSFGTVFALCYFDTSVKSVEQVEEKIGLPILGNVPLKDKKSRRKR